MAGVAGFGTVLKIGGTAGTAMVGVTNFDGPGMSADKLDMGAHDSPNAFKEIGVGLLDAGDVTMRVNWDPSQATHANTTGLLGYFEDRTKETYALIFPDSGGTTYVFDAYVTQYQPTAPYDGKLEATITLSIDGDPTLA